MRILYQWTGQSHGNREVELTFLTKFADLCSCDSIQGPDGLTLVYRFDCGNLSADVSGGMRAFKFIHSCSLRRD